MDKNHSRVAQLLLTMFLLVQFLRGPAQHQGGWSAGIGTPMVVLKALPSSLPRKAAGCGVAAEGFWLALVDGERVSQARLAGSGARKQSKMHGYGLLFKILP